MAILLRRHVICHAITPRITLPLLRHATFRMLLFLRHAIIAFHYAIDAMRHYATPLLAAGATPC